MTTTSLNPFTLTIPHQKEQTSCAYNCISQRCCDSNGFRTFRSEAEYSPNFHDSAVAPLTKQDTLVFPEGNPPHSLTRLGKISYKLACRPIPELNSTIVAAGDHKSVIELDGVSADVRCCMLDHEQDGKTNL